MQTALRECYEECGLIPGCMPAVPASLAVSRTPEPEWRSKVSLNAALFRSTCGGCQLIADIVSEYGSPAMVTALRRVCHFITPTIEARRFDTVFYASVCVL